MAKTNKWKGIYDDTPLKLQVRCQQSGILFLQGQEQGPKVHLHSHVHGRPLTQGYPEDGFTSPERWFPDTHQKPSLTWQRDKGTLSLEVLSASQTQVEVSHYRTDVSRKTVHGFCQRCIHNLLWGLLLYTVMLQKLRWAEASHWQGVQPADQGDLHFLFPPLWGQGGGGREVIVPATTGATRYQPRWDRYSGHRGRTDI